MITEDTFAFWALAFLLALSVGAVAIVGFFELVDRGVTFKHLRQHLVKNDSARACAILVVLALVAAITELVMP